MNTQGRNILQKIRLLAHVVVTMAIVLASNPGHAGTLNISNNVLEVTTGVEPNIVLLSDDSTSMDFGLMTLENEGIMYLGGAGYWYAQPDTGVLGFTAPARNVNVFVLASEDFLIASGGGLLHRMAVYGGHAARITTRFTITLKLPTTLGRVWITLV